MSRIREWFTRLWKTIGPDRHEGDLEKELRLHLEFAAEDARKRGDSQEQALRVARLREGALEPVVEALRDQYRLPWLTDLGRDLRHACRQLGKTPGFAAATGLTLALGIGANTVSFSVIKTVLLRPLPFPEADRVVWVVENLPQEQATGGRRRYPPIELADLGELRAQTETLDAVGVHTPAAMTLMTQDGPRRLMGARMSHDLFSILGARPALGRTFTTAEEGVGAESVVVLSSATWRTHFGGNPDVLGESVTLDDAAYTVVGVMAPDFQFPDGTTEFWMPAPTGRTFGRSQRVRPVARLTEGVTLREATTELSTLLYRLRGISPAEDRLTGFTRFEVVPVQDEIAEASRGALGILPVATGLVLLIACMNVAHLLVARMMARRREVAIRVALGASRGRVVRQLLVENLVVSVLGALAGLAVAYGGIGVLQRLGASLPRRDLSPGVSIPRVEELTLDGPALAFALALGLLAGIVCSLVPAGRHLTAASFPRPGSPEPPGLIARVGRVHGGLVVAEIALATTLLVAGALLAQSFIRLATVDPGYDASNVVTFRARLPRAATTTDNAALGDAVIERLASLPGVHSVAYASSLPMVTRRFRGGMPMKAPTAPAAHWPVDATPPSLALQASRRFFATMGIDVVDGRSFSQHPRTAWPREALVNEAFARSGYAGERPLGRVVYSRGDYAFRIVGIVSDVRQFGLDQRAAPEMYHDARISQWLPGSAPYFAVRMDSDPTPLLSSLREILTQVDPRAALDSVATMQQIVSNSVLGPRLYAALGGTLAGVAVSLAAIGVYGLVTFGVRGRTSEIGVRRSFGAGRLDVVALVLRQSILTSVAGVLLGLAGAAVVTRYLTSLLFGLDPLEPAVYGGVAVTLGSVATLAGLIPARRALRIEPVVALRVD